MRRGGGRQGGREREMGETGRDGSQHWGPMQGCRRWRGRRRGWRGYRVLQGAQAGHGWQRSIPSVCGHVSAPWYTKPGGVGRFHWDYYFSEFQLSRRKLIQFLRCLFSCFLWLKLFWDKGKDAVGGKPILPGCRVEIIHIFNLPCKINWF